MCSSLSNFTLQYMPLPLSDISQAYRSAPERTEQALTKVSIEKKKKARDWLASSESSFTCDL